MRRAFLLLVALVAAGCPPVPEDGRFRCARDGDCGAELRCLGGVCQPCAPLACGAPFDRCGSFPDGCGGTVTCSCAAPETCGGGGEAGRCGCEPSCAAAYPACGELTDACGTARCECPRGEVCADPAMTCCRPATCAERGATCGEIDDGCGGRAACGGCGPFEACAGGRCGPPASCVAEGRACGASTAGERCGVCGLGRRCEADGRCRPPPECAGLECGWVTTATPTTYCGGCPVGLACAEGRCVALARPPYCLGPKVEWLKEAVPVRHPVLNATVFPGPSGLEALVNSGATELDDTGCSRFRAARLFGHGRLDPASLGPVEAFATFPELAPNRDCTPRTDVACTGFLGRIRIRRDGLEGFFTSDHPCADWEDAEAYLVHRDAPGAPWRGRVHLPALGTYENRGDPVSSLVLLADDRTLLVATGGLALAVFRRASTRAGDASFAPSGAVPFASFEPGAAAIDGLELSADGRHLLYARNQSDRIEARYAAISSLDPLTLGPGAELSPDLPSGRIDVAEAEDGSGVYFTNYTEAWFAPRRACP